MKVYGALEVAQFESFASGSKPAASAYPYRVIWLTDTKVAQVSDGSVWISLGGAPGAGSLNVMQFDATTTLGSTSLLNMTFTASVAANALTVALKTKSGTDATAADIVTIGMRSATITSSVYNLRSVTAALSIVIPSATTLGSVNGTQSQIYVYAVDNAGTVELALSLTKFADEGGVITTTAISGGTSRNLMYSTTARTSVPFRLLGRIKVTEATAGTWATAPSEITVAPFENVMPSSIVKLRVGNGHGSTNTKIRRFTTTDKNFGTAITYADSSSLGGSCTIIEDGNYVATYSDRSSAGSCSIGISVNTTEPTISIISLVNSADSIGYNDSSAANFNVTFSAPMNLKNGDVVRAHTSGTPNAATANDTHFTLMKVS